MTTTYKLRIEENPGGYSEGTYGYVIERVEDGAPTGDLWFDGGYSSRELAREAGAARRDEIQEA